MSEPAIQPTRSTVRSRQGRRRKEVAFRVFCLIAAASSMIVLAVLLTTIFLQGYRHLDWDFITSPPSRRPEDAGIFPAMVGSIFIMLVCAFTAVPIGVSAAIFLEEYKPRQRWAKRVHGFVQLNIANLAGVPSVVYGILGLTVFVSVFNVFGNTSTPDYEIGAEYHDYIVDYGGNRIIFPLDDRMAPPTPLVDGVTGQTPAGEPVTLSFVTAEDAAAKRQAAEAAIAARLEGRLEPLLDHLATSIKVSEDRHLMQAAEDAAEQVLATADDAELFSNQTLATHKDAAMEAGRGIVEDAVEELAELLANLTAERAQAAGLITQEQGEELTGRRARRDLRAEAEAALESQKRGSYAGIADAIVKHIATQSVEEGFIRPEQREQIVALGPAVLKAAREQFRVFSPERLREFGAAIIEELRAGAIRDQLEGLVVAGDLPAVQRTSERSWYYLRMPLGRSVLAGGLTLMLVVLPVIIIASQEALRAVPDSLRRGALALGATRWQMVWNITLPASMSGIMTGTILAMSRAIGEAAPILVIAGVVYITFTPGHLMDDFTAMPLQIFDWASRPSVDFHEVAAAGILVLLAVLLTFNAVAVFIRYRFQRSL